MSISIFVSNDGCYIERLFLVNTARRGLKEKVLEDKIALNAVVVKTRMPHLEFDYGWIVCVISSEDCISHRVTCSKFLFGGRVNEESSIFTRIVVSKLGSVATHGLDYPSWSLFGA